MQRRSRRRASTSCQRTGSLRWYGSSRRVRLSSGMQTGSVVLLCLMLVVLRRLDQSSTAYSIYGDGGSSEVYYREETWDGFYGEETETTYYDANGTKLGSS